MFHYGDFFCEKCLSFLLKTDFYFCLYTYFYTYFYTFILQAQSPKVFFTFSQSSLIFEKLTTLLNSETLFKFELFR